MKNLLFCLGLILSLMLTVSCSSNKDDENLGTPMQLSEMDKTNSTLESLKHFNDSLSVIPQPRWSWKNFTRALAVSGADIIGAAAGIAANKDLILVAGGTTGGTGAAVAAAVAGTICGAGASYIAYCETKDYTISVDKITVEEIMSGIPVGSFQMRVDNTGDAPLALMNCGAVHNIALANIIDRPDDGPVPVTSNYEYTASELAKGNLDESKMIPTYNEIVSSLIPAIQDNYNYQAALLDMKNKGIISDNLCKLYNLFLEVYETYPKEQEDLDFIVEKYLSAIKSSAEFSKDEKECIYLGLSVALESPGFWLDRLN